MNDSNAMHIEIWSDVVYPWCYIGKRRFEAALARFEHRDDMKMTWRSFELDLNSPQRTPGSLNETLAKNMGTSVAQAAAMNGHGTTMAAGEGLGYRLDEAQHGNPFDAHPLIHLAAVRGLQEEAKERLPDRHLQETVPS